MILELILNLKNLFNTHKGYLLSPTIIYIYIYIYIYDIMRTLFLYDIMISHIG